MKKQYIIKMLAAFLVVSCNSFDDDININPNLPSEASGTQLIANAELSLYGLSSSPKGEFMAQYLSETQYVGTSLYPQESTSFYSWYEGPLNDLEAVITSDNLSGNQGPVENQKAVAKILKSYYYWNLTDRWGDLPYSEALKGSDNFKPVYDTQEAIYNDLFIQLEQANAMMVSGSISDDIIYGGNMIRWKKLANSIHLLMALRLSEVNPTKAKEEFVKAWNAGVLESNSDNFVFQHLADANNQNYWYGQVVDGNREWWALSEGLVAEMKPVNDPRLPIYGNPNRTNGEYIGLKYGEEDAIGTEEFSLLGSNIIAQDAPIYLLTYAQVLFAVAEASARGWVSEDTEMYYNTAITESMKQWTGSASGIEDFLVNTEIMFDDARAIEQIATQRWVHLFMFGYEAWAEWRRTGFPNNLVEPNGVAVPNRLSYPDNEAFLNETNYQEALQRQFGGDDSIYGNVWWAD